MIEVIAAFLAWAGIWVLNTRLANGPASNTRAVQLLVPVLFGVTILVVWELVVRGLNVPMVILPAPTSIAATIGESVPTLWNDFVQTFVKGALSGFAIGVAAAFVVAIFVDRSEFLSRGLVPVANFLAALPIVGTAPILVMWYGYDWQSKAAVVVAMVFFPMLVNISAGLQETTPMQRDQMKTWAASYWQAFWKLRLPAAMPFLFNGLKICSTLALIGAIVAEFFGSPLSGMGFRISVSVGRLSLDMVWAEIFVAALAGSLFYGVIALVEQWVTFWHPSQRKGR
ncbi:ABC transporter permease [Pseudooceanicola sp. HF7]|uniref:ABC transporter permease n=1 Tax=Pseudooceanicola sp. HF7 TaxID=2721560 RepID=UPI00143012A2|nr:ABC transporter permease [Pseudooceanicola sp. HF7]NIZ08071.1 ABC transporter permease [Pseudooceanicola sp. HF7]